jgi:hypothetical protein
MCEGSFSSYIHVVLGAEKWCIHTFLFYASCIEFSPHTRCCAVGAIMLVVGVRNSSHYQYKLACRKRAGRGHELKSVCRKKAARRLSRGMRTERE